MNENYFVNDEEWRLWFKQMLGSLAITVTFVKADGSLREMDCTLMEEHLPESTVVKKNAIKKVKSDETLTVFDLEKQEWRSFRWDSIISMNIKFKFNFK